MPILEIIFLIGAVIVGFLAAWIIRGINLAKFVKFQEDKLAEKNSKLAEVSQEIEKLRKQHREQQFITETDQKNWKGMIQAEREKADRSERHAEKLVLRLNELEQQTTDNEKLQAEIKDRTERLSMLQRNLHNKDAQVTQAEHKLSEQTFRLSLLQSQLEERSANYRKVIVETQERLRRAEVALREKIEANALLEKQLKEARGHMENGGQIFAESLAINASGDGETAGVQPDVTSLLRQKEDEVKLLQNRIAEFQPYLLQLRDRETEIALLKNQIETQAGENTDLRHKLSAQESETMRLTNQLHIQEAESARLISLVTNNQQIDDKLKELESAMIEKDNIIEHLKEELRELSNQREEAQEKLNHLSDLESQLTELIELREKHQTQQTELEMLRSQVAQVEQIRAENRELEVVDTHYRLRTIPMLEAQLQLRNIEIANLNKRLEQLKGVEAECEECRRRTADLQNRFDHLEAELRAIRESKASPTEAQTESESAIVSTALPVAALALGGAMVAHELTDDDRTEAVAEAETETLEAAGTETVAEVAETQPEMETETAEMPDEPESTSEKVEEPQAENAELVTTEETSEETGQVSFEEKSEEPETVAATETSREEIETAIDEQTAEEKSETAMFEETIEETPETLLAEEKAEEIEMVAIGETDENQVEYSADNQSEMKPLVDGSQFPETSFETEDTPAVSVEENEHISALMPETETESVADKVVESEISEEISVSEPETDVQPMTALETETKFSHETAIVDSTEDRDVLEIAEKEFAEAKNKYVMAETAATETVSEAESFAKTTDEGFAETENQSIIESVAENTDEATEENAIVTEEAETLSSDSSFSLTAEEIEDLDKTIVDEDWRPSPVPTTAFEEPDQTKSWDIVSKDTESNNMTTTKAASLINTEDNTNLTENTESAEKAVEETEVIHVSEEHLQEDGEIVSFDEAQGTETTETEPTLETTVEAIANEEDKGETPKDEDEGSGMSSVASILTGAAALFGGALGATVGAVSSLVGDNEDGENAENKEPEAKTEDESQPELKTEDEFHTTEEITPGTDETAMPETSQTWLLHQSFAPEDAINAESSQAFLKADQPVTQEFLAKVQHEEEAVTDDLVAESLPELPSNDRLRLQIQSPTRIFLYWNLKDNPRATLQKALGMRAENYTLGVRLVHLATNESTFYPTEISGTHWFDVVSGEQYRADAGFSAPNRPFIRLLSSNVVETPRPAPSWRNDEEGDWVMTTARFAEVLDKSGYSHAIVPMILNVREPETNDAATLLLANRLTGTDSETLGELKPAELRWFLVALAAGMPLDELRGVISPELHGWLNNTLEENPDALSAENVKAALKDIFGEEVTRIISSEEENKQRLSWKVFGASAIHFPEVVFPLIGKMISSGLLPKDLFPSSPAFSLTH
jgi:hypothetical protein